jgi:two-component system cell cycle response regulator DivK
MILPNTTIAASLRPADRADRTDLTEFRATSPLILVADDHDDSRTIARLVLESANFRVIEARTGHEAIALARAERPLAVLLDIVMPELDGWEAARRIRADLTTASTAIIAVTALAGSADRERSFAAGCDAVLTKPVPPRLLLDALRRCAYRRTPSLTMEPALVSRRAV